MKKSISMLTYAVLFSVGIASAQSNYKIVNKIHIDGDEGWDLLAMDESTSRLFLSHGRIVQVVDVKNGKLIGTIPDTKGVHGIALSTDLNKGYTSNGKDSSVTVFNLKTLAVIKKIPVTGRNPDAILYDEFTHKVFVYNGRSSNATVIDATSDKVVGTIPLDGKPELSVTDGKGKIYVNLEDKSMVSMIDAKTLKVEQTWSVAPGIEPSGIAIDNKNHRLFIVCDNKLMVVMNAQTGQVITTLPIGEHVDGVAYDPIKKRVYSSNGEGTVTVVQEGNENTFKIIENIVTQKGAKTIAINTKTHHLYLTTAEFGITPEPTKEKPKPRLSIKPNTFVVLDVAPIK
ncbi:MAG: YncE family protein [Bacteroidia bacterium]